MSEDDPFLDEPPRKLKGGDILYLAYVCGQIERTAIGLNSAKHEARMIADRYRQRFDSVPAPLRRLLNSYSDDSLIAIMQQLKASKPTIPKPPPPPGHAGHTPIWRGGWLDMPEWRRAFHEYFTGVWVERPDYRDPIGPPSPAEMEKARKTREEWEAIDARHKELVERKGNSYAIDFELAMIARTRQRKGLGNPSPPSP